MVLKMLCRVLLDKCSCVVVDWCSVEVSCVRLKMKRSDTEGEILKPDKYRVQIRVVPDSSFPLFGSPFNKNYPEKSVLFVQ
jgi:hypothetical protein